MKIFDRTFKAFFASNGKVKKSESYRYTKAESLKIQYVYEVEAENLNLNQAEKLAIDVGLENLYEVFLWKT